MLCTECAVCPPEYSRYYLHIRQRLIRVIILFIIVTCKSQLSICYLFTSRTVKPLPLVRQRKAERCSQYQNLKTGLEAADVVVLENDTVPLYLKWSYKSRRDVELNKLRHSLIPDADTGICSVVRCQIAGIWPRRSDSPSRWARTSTCPSVSPMFEAKISTIRSP